MIAGLLVAYGAGLFLGFFIAVPFCLIELDWSVPESLCVAVFWPLALVVACLVGARALSERARRYVEDLDE